MRCGIRRTPVAASRAACCLSDRVARSAHLTGATSRANRVSIPPADRATALALRPCRHKNGDMNRRPLTCVLMALLATLFSTHSLAGKVYKHVDANGITHYSDRPPAGQSPDMVETLHYRHESQQFVTLRLDGSGQARRALAFNRLHGPV